MRGLFLVSLFLKLLEKACGANEHHAFLIVCGGVDVRSGAEAVISNAQLQEKEDDSIVRHVIYQCPPGPVEQALLVSNLAANGTYVDNELGPMKVKGFAVSVSSEALMTPVINEAVAAGFPVVTISSDAPSSNRALFIGANNTFLGEQLAKNLYKVQPDGGKYIVVGSSSEVLTERWRSFDAQVKAKGKWKEFSGSPLLVDSPFDNETGAMEFSSQLQTTIIQNNITALIALQASIMGDNYWIKIVDDDRTHNVSLILGDGSADQVSLIKRGFAQGIVGQIPYEMGYSAMNAILDILAKNMTNVSLANVETDVIVHTRIPYVLPPLQLDNNLIGGLRYAGYTCFTVIAVCCFIAAAWAYHARAIYIVKASQPIFLVMVACGVLIMSACLIPLSMDDSSYLYDSEDKTFRNTAICMSTPWLGFVGFSICFSALFSKTWRINRILLARSRFQRMRVTERDVMVPFAMQLSANILVLMVWTILDPLTYVRRAHAGVDGWNRVISTYGSCKSNNATPYLVALMIINAGVLVIANWQAYRARHLESEFAESRSIGIAMASMMQAATMGIPVLFIARDNPKAFYLILVFLVFIVCMATLLLVFVPKMVFAELFRRRTPEEQAMFVRQSIRTTRQQCDGGSGGLDRRRSLQRMNSSDHFNMAGSFDSFPQGAARRSPQRRPPVGVLVIDRSQTPNEAEKEDEGADSNQTEEKLSTEQDGPLQEQ